MTIKPSSFAFLLVAASMSSTIVTASNKLRTASRNLQTYTQYSEYSQLMLDAVNAERAKAGVPALCTNSKLAAAAQRHSDDMAANNYMDHVGSDGSSLSQRVTQAGYDWETIAENVAAGQEDVSTVMNSWMESEGHRTNILNGDYTMFGTAYAYNTGSDYKHYWTQNFGASTTDACDSDSTTESQTAPMSPDTNPSASAPISPVTNPSAPAPMSPVTNPSAPAPVSPVTNPSAPAPVSPVTNPSAPKFKIPFGIQWSPVQMNPFAAPSNHA